MNKHLVITSGAADFRLRLQVVNSNFAATQTPPAKDRVTSVFLAVYLKLVFAFFFQELWVKKGEDVLIEFHIAQLLDLD